MALDPDARLLLRLASRYSYLGIFLGVAIMVGYFGGVWLDGRFGTKPYLSLVGLGVGIASGLRELLRVAKRGQADAERDDAGDDSDGREP